MEHVIAIGAVAALIAAAIVLFRPSGGQKIHPVYLRKGKLYLKSGGGEPIRCCRCDRDCSDKCNAFLTSKGEVIFTCTGERRRLVVMEEE